LGDDVHGRFEVGLIGAGIGDSLSPALHEREAAVIDLDELGRPPEEVGELLREARGDGLRGVNVTHPCKQLVVDELDELSPEAAALGAVNTVVFGPAGMAGHNTDATGFQEAFVRGLPGAPTREVVLLGAGGAGAAVAHAMLSLGADRLVVVDAERDRADALVATLTARFAPGNAEAADPTGLQELLAAADGLVHATPTGMAAHPGTAVPAELLDPSLWVAELVYMPVETTLLRDARAAGCRTLDGAAMVALQAAGSLELFTGVPADRDRMLRHIEELFAGRREAA
jgi:shikimate dehydrogenase